MSYLNIHLKRGLDVLNSSYSIKVIDGGDSIYKDYKNGVEVEIYVYKKKYQICIWYRRYIEEQIEEVKLDRLKSILYELEKKYDAGISN